jgi:hypothetical protein
MVLSQLQDYLLIAAVPEWRKSFSPEHGTKNYHSKIWHQVELLLKNIDWLLRNIAPTAKLKQKSFVNWLTQMDPNVWSSMQQRKQKKIFTCLTKYGTECIHDLHL